MYAFVAVVGLTPKPSYSALCPEVSCIYSSQEVGVQGPAVTRSEL